MVGLFVTQENVIKDFDLNNVYEATKTKAQKKEESKKEQEEKKQEEGKKTR